MAAIGASFIIYTIPTTPFTDDRLQLFLKSVKINSNFMPTLHSSITIDILHQIIQACTVLPSPETFTALYLFAFLSVLRLSNILPHSLKAFDSTRQLCRGDIIFSTSHAVVIVQWSKILQDRKTFATVAISVLDHSHLCPVAALQTMLQKIPGSNNDPLFQKFSAGRWVPLTDSIARKHLKKVSYLLNVQPTFTFHDFRRAGTSWGFHHVVSLEHIMQPGSLIQFGNIFLLMHLTLLRCQTLSIFIYISRCIPSISLPLPWCLGLCLQLHFDLTGHFSDLIILSLIKIFQKFYFCILAPSGLSWAFGPPSGDTGGLYCLWAYITFKFGKLHCLVLV